MKKNILFIAWVALFSLFASNSQAQSLKDSAQQRQHLQSSKCHHRDTRNDRHDRYMDLQRFGSRI